MSDTITSEDRRRLVGRRLPDGAFTIDPDEHASFCDAVFAGPWEHAEAHPAFMHLVAHVGKGMPLEAFFDLIGTHLEDGVTFGEGQLEYARPLKIGVTYSVSTTISAVERKHGRRKGAFDVVTTFSEVRDADGVVGSSRESYVVPERAA